MKLLDDFEDASPVLRTQSPILDLSGPQHFSLDSRKRKRTVDNRLTNDETSKSPKFSDLEFENNTILAKSEYLAKHIEVPPLIYPKSLYRDGESKMARSPEDDALDNIMTDLGPGEDESGTFLEAELHDFTIYRPHAGRFSPKQRRLREAALANTMVCLHEFIECNVQNFLVDGLIVHPDGKSNVLERVPFKLLSIGAMQNLRTSSVGSEMWIQSFKGQRSGIWYRLVKPSPEHKRYHDQFVWMANLAKYVVDYIASAASVQEIHLSDFKESFCEWVKCSYPQQGVISTWLARYGDSDFRRMIASQGTFLYSQASQVDTAYAMCPLWAEACPRYLSSIPKQIESTGDQPSRWFKAEGERSGMLQRKTTVTPFTFRCFETLPWHILLHPQTSKNRSKDERQYAPWTLKQEATGLETLIKAPHHENASRPPEAAVIVGDVVSVAADSSTPWKNQGLEWYAYVQEVVPTDKGQQLSLIWLYKPSDTACMKMKYMYEHLELFLATEHCNCNDSPIFASEIIRKPKVVFFGSPEEAADNFFCRQAYLDTDSAWVTLQKSHFICPCKTTKISNAYSIGQTVLWKPRSYRKPLLEPAIILGFDSGRVSIRRLLRRAVDLGITEAAHNELVYTDRIESIEVKSIERLCHIRFYHHTIRDQKAIPAPYNRGGLGNFWFICSTEDELGYQDLAASWRPDFSQGWDPEIKSVQRPLRALDIFCGGGNFARGVEEGGAVECHWAVDYSAEAIHTYKANLGATANVKLYWGSVNQYLSEAIEGKNQDGLIARRGEVDIIIAGSPCQGFSLANPNKGSIKGLINESMVASVVSCIDFYRPKYAILENVKGMAAGGEDKNVFSAVLCAIVALGYQVRTFVLDAWSFGSPQSRTRIFISCTAPGLPPMPEPFVTHSHPQGTIAASLGRAANGLQIGARCALKTPFHFVSAGQATQDLPTVNPGLTSIAFPDHREPVAVSALDRTCISSVPKFPAGLGFLAAHKCERMPLPQVEEFAWDNRCRASKASRAWTRVRQDRLFNTMMTCLRPWDRFNGTCLHWEQHRLLTILEARRAQGFLDQDVILGSSVEQFKIVGNSVARPVALALGLALREAWLEGMPLSPVDDLSATLKVQYASDKISPKIGTADSALPNALRDLATLVKLDRHDQNYPISAQHDL